MSLAACPGQFHCGSNVCIPTSKVCDSNLDCLNGSDELGCATPSVTSTVSYSTTPTGNYVVNFILAKGNRFECFRSLLPLKQTNSA